MLYSDISNYLWALYKFELIGYPEYARAVNILSNRLGWNVYLWENYKYDIR